MPPDRSGKHPQARIAKSPQARPSTFSRPQYQLITTERDPSDVNCNLSRDPNSLSAVVATQSSLPDFRSTAGDSEVPGSQSSAMMENIRDVTISGGSFVMAEVAHIHQLPTEGSQGSNGSSLVVSDPENDGVDEPDQGAALNNSQSIQRKDYDIYYDHLLLAGRGSPMWIPGPNAMLSKEYRRNGMGIGDVGIIYRLEGFSFLFNIFLGADHPVNEGSVPDDFEPFDFGKVKKDLQKTFVCGRGHHFASSSLQKISGVDSSGFIFETFAREGAILIMPDGATTQDLLNHKLVKKYIAKNAKSWYDYIVEERGREVENGDIRLVIGFDKVSSWGIATFARTIEEQVRLEFKTIGSDQAASRTYIWNCVGGGDIKGRIGPEEEEMDDLRDSSDVMIKNQTVFVRTLNFNLSGETWEDLTAHKIRSGDHSSNGSQPNQWLPFNLDLSGGQSGSRSRESHSNQNVNFQAAQFGLSIPRHPSNRINKLLLEKFPTARIAITSDADWISVLTKEDVILPSPEVLCSRLLSSSKMWEEDGIVTIHDDHANSDDELSVTGKQDCHIDSAEQQKDEIRSMLHEYMVVGQDPSPSINQDYELDISISVHQDSSYPYYETTGANTSGSSLVTHHSPRSLLPVHIPGHNDTFSHSPPASPSWVSRRTPSLLPPLNLGSPNLQQTSLSTSELSPLKVHQLSYFETQQTVHPPAGPSQGFLEPPRPLYHRRTSTTALPLNYEHPGVRRRTSSASCESFFMNTGTQPVADLSPSMTNYRETSPHFSDASPVGSPSFSENDPSSANSPTAVEVISSASPASPSIAVFNVDSASLFYHSVNSPVAGPDFSPSVGSASPSGSIDLNLGRTLSAITNLSDVVSETDFHSPLNQLFFLESCQYQQHQDVDRPQRPSVSADGIAPCTPSSSMLFSIPSKELPVVLDDYPNLSRHPAMPLTSSSSAMKGMAYSGQMTGLNREYGLEAMNLSTLSGFPSETDSSSGTIEPLYTGGPPNPADEGRIPLSGYSHPHQSHLPTVHRHIYSEQVLQDQTLDDKLKVYQILATSSERVEVTSRIRELVRKVGRPHFSQILDCAIGRRVKLTPASEQKAKERRKRAATFRCLLCEALFTTNNNLQNHYRSHLCLNPYRCGRCGKAYRTEGSLNRHVNGKVACPRISEQS